MAMPVVAAVSDPEPSRLHCTATATALPAGMSPIAQEV